MFQLEQTTNFGDILIQESFSILYLLSPKLKIENAFLLNLEDFALKITRRLLIWLLIGFVVFSLIEWIKLLG